MQQLKPKDIIAIIVIIGMIFLKFTTQNNELDTIVALIIGYYFGRRHTGDDAGK